MVVCPLQTACLPGARLKHDRAGAVWKLPVCLGTPRAGINLFAPDCAEAIGGLVGGRCLFAQGYTEASGDSENWSLLVPLALLRNVEGSPGICVCLLQDLPEI